MRENMDAISIRRAGTALNRQHDQSAFGCLVDDWQFALQFYHRLYYWYISVI